MRVLELIAMPSTPRESGCEYDYFAGMRHHAIGTGSIISISCHHILWIVLMRNSTCMEFKVVAWRKE